MRCVGGNTDTHTDTPGRAMFQRARLAGTRDATFVKEKKKQYDTAPKERGHILYRNEMARLLSSIAYYKSFLLFRCKYMRERSVSTTKARRMGCWTLFFEIEATLAG